MAIAHSGSALVDVQEGRGAEPVVIQVRGHHAYKNRGKGKNGCGYLLADGSPCMKAKTHADHLSLPISLNEIGSRGGHFTYAAFKKAWEEVLLIELSRSGWPRGWKVAGEERIECVMAEGVICFPKMPTRGRDQGNFRWFLEKVLGDALTQGGYIEDDSYWPIRRFEFGNLDMQHVQGEAWTQIMLLPS